MLAEFSDQAGNFPQVFMAQFLVYILSLHKFLLVPLFLFCLWKVTRVLLGKVDTSKPGRVSILYDQYMFHHLTHDGLTFLCMTDKEAGDRVRAPYAFLEDVKTEFIGTYGDRAQRAIAFEMNAAYGPRLESRMRSYNEGGAGQDNIGVVQDKLEAVKDVMVQNIEQILERGEKLELLVDKTDQLSQTAFQFQKSSRKLRQAMFWRKVKIYGLIATAVLFAIWLITVWACNIDYSGCGNDEKR